MSILRRPLGWSRRHPDLLAILLIVAVSSLPRAALMFRAPPLYVVASRPYYQAALQIFFGQEMTALSVRRVPGYTLFLLAVFWLFGVDPQAVVFVQHLLGIGSAVLCYLIGRQVVNRFVGLAAGLLAGANTTLVAYEHQILSEPVFLFWFLLALYLVVAAIQKRSKWLFVLAGVVVGAGSLTRILGQIVLISAPLALWLYERRWRPTAVGTACLLAGFALVAGPWIIRNTLVYSEANLASGGSPLLSTMMHERPYTRGFFAYENPRDPDPTRFAARRIIERMAPDEPDPLDIWDELRARLGVSPTEANRLMSEIALDSIARHPWHFAQVYARKVWNLYALPRDEYWQTYASRTNGQWPGKYTEDQIEDGLIPDLKPSTFTTAHRWEAGNAAAVADFFRPTRAASLLALLFTIGVIAALLRPDRRLVLVPALALLGSIVVTGIIVGDKPRYRYPLDPIIGIVAMAGVVTLAESAVALARRGLSTLRDRQVSAPAS